MTVAPAEPARPLRRCPVCRGGVTDPALDDARAVEWHLENCMRGEELHVALHRLLNHPVCCHEEDR